MRDEQRNAQGSGASMDGYRVLSYLLAGVGLYGGLGWLGDSFFGTHWLLPVGIIVGMAASVYLVVKQTKERRA